MNRLGSALLATLSVATASCDHRESDKSVSASAAALAVARTETAEAKAAVDQATTTGTREDFDAAKRELDQAAGAIAASDAAQAADAPQ